MLHNRDNRALQPNVQVGLMGGLRRYKKEDPRKKLRRNMVGHSRSIFTGGMFLAVLQCIKFTSCCSPSFSTFDLDLRRIRWLRFRLFPFDGQPQCAVYLQWILDWHRFIGSQYVMRKCLYFQRTVNFGSRKFKFHVNSHFRTGV